MLPHDHAVTIAYKFLCDVHERERENEGQRIKRIILCVFKSAHNACRTQSNMYTDTHPYTSMERIYGLIPKYYILYAISSFLCFGLE